MQSENKSLFGKPGCIQFVVEGIQSDGVEVLQNQIKSAKDIFLIQQGELLEINGLMQGEQFQSIRGNLVVII